MQHFSSVFPYFGGGLVAFPSLMGQSTGGQDRDLPPAEGACEDRATVAVHTLSTTWAWSSLSCSAQSEALSSAQPFSSLGFSVNGAHLGCFFALLQASCSITASTQRRLGLDYFHSFLILKGIAFRSRDLASIFIKLPFSEVGRKKPRAGAARGWVGALPAGSDATRQQPQRDLALSSPPNSAGFFCFLCLKGFGFSVTTPQGEAVPGLRRGTLLPISLLAKAPSVTPSSSWAGFLLPAQTSQPRPQPRRWLQQKEEETTNIFFPEQTSIKGATSGEGCATAASGILRAPGTHPFRPSCSGKARGNVVGQLIFFFFFSR